MSWSFKFRFLFCKYTAFMVLTYKSYRHQKGYWYQKKKGFWIPWCTVSTRLIFVSQTHIEDSKPHGNDLIFIFRPYSAIYTSCMTYEYVGNLARETKHQRKGHIRHVDIFYSPLEVSSSFVPRYNGWSRFLAIGDWWMGWSPQVLVETGGGSGSGKGDEEI